MIPEGEVIAKNSVTLIARSCSQEGNGPSLEKRTIKMQLGRR